MTSWWSKHPGGTRPCVLKGADAHAAQPVTLAVRLPTSARDLVETREQRAKQEGDKPALANYGFSGLLEEAYATGYQDGLTQASTEAAEKVASEIARMSQERSERIDRAVKALEDAAISVMKARAETARVATEDITEFSFRLTEILVGRELELSKDPGMDSIARALALAPCDEPLRIHVHPDDASTLAELDPLETKSETRAVTIIADPAVERSGCTLDAGPCHIDAQMGSALERVRIVLQSAGTRWTARTPEPATSGTSHPGELSGAEQ